MPKSIFALLLAISFLLTSCFSELANDFNKIDELRWNPSLALPLANGSFTIDEFAEELSGDNFSTGARPDGLVVFYFSQDQVFSENAEDQINIQDENYVSSIAVPLGDLPDLPVNGSVSTQRIHEFGVNTSFNDKLYSATLKGGTLEIDLAGNFPASGELVFTFNGLTLDGQTMQTTFQWTYDGSNTQRFQRTIDLAGLEMDLTDGGTTFNYFYFTSDLTLFYEGQTVTTSQQLDLSLDLLNMEFSDAFATVAERVIATESNQFTLNFLDDLNGGQYYFDEPSINFHFANSFGVPLSATIIEATASSVERGDLALTGSAVGNPFTMGYPTINEIGTVVDSDITLNHENSNLPQLLAFQPNTISYTFQGTVNPDGNDETHFVLDTSRISADIDLELPMIGRFRNLTFVENYDFDAQELEEVEYALFRLTSSNGFPINTDMQLYFRNSSGFFIDSLIYDDSRVLEAGITDSNGKVTTPTVKELDVLIPKDRLGPISTATSLVMRARLDTPENQTQSVRIYEDDRLDVKLYIQTEFEIIL